MQAHNALVGHVRHGDAGGAHQQLGVEMMGDAGPDRGKRKLSRPLLGVSDQLQERMGGNRRIDDQDERNPREARERNEIDGRIIR